MVWLNLYFNMFTYCATLLPRGVEFRAPVDTTDNLLFAYRVSDGPDPHGVSRQEPEH